MPPGCFHFTSSTAALEVPSKFALPGAATTATPVTTQAPASTATPATTAQGAYTVPLCIGTSHQCLLANLYHDSLGSQLNQAAALGPACLWACMWWSRPGLSTRSLLQRCLLAATTATPATTQAPATTPAPSTTAAGAQMLHVPRRS